MDTRADVTTQAWREWSPASHDACSSDDRVGQAWWHGGGCFVAWAITRRRRSWRRRKRRREACVGVPVRHLRARTPVTHRETEGNADSRNADSRRLAVHSAHNQLEHLLPHRLVVPRGAFMPTAFTSLPSCPPAPLFVPVSFQSSPPAITGLASSSDAPRVALSLSATSALVSLTCVRPVRHPYALGSLISHARAPSTSPALPFSVPWVLHPRRTP